MKSITRKLEASQPAAETAVHLFDNWFDPIEAGLRDRVREFIHAMIEGVAQQVIERRFKLFQDVAINVGGAAEDVELHRFAECSGEVADQAREPLRPVDEGPHPAGDDFAIEAAIEIIRLA